MRSPARPRPNRARMPLSPVKTLQNLPSRNQPPLKPQPKCLKMLLKLPKMQPQLLKLPPLKVSPTPLTVRPLLLQVKMPLLLLRRLHPAVRALRSPAKTKQLKAPVPVHLLPVPVRPVQITVKIAPPDPIQVLPPQRKVKPMLPHRREPLRQVLQLLLRVNRIPAVVPHPQQTALKRQKNMPEPTRRFQPKVHRQMQQPLAQRLTKKRTKTSSLTQTAM
nr:MAG TPA: hypothetical protein [Caudoviricetes sp.]